MPEWTTPYWPVGQLPLDNRTLSIDNPVHPLGQVHPPENPSQGGNREKVPAARAPRTWHSHFRASAASLHLDQLSGVELHHRVGRQRRGRPGRRIPNRDATESLS